jgi:4-aminobutyrate aminotransferase
VISSSYTRSYPLVAARGEGAIVEDVDGNRFLDFSAGIAVVATGHCHPRVVEAIQRQAAQLIHMSGTDFYYENMVVLAEKLAALTPGGIPRRVYFGNSGTEAIEAAIKMARYHTGRKQFVAFYGAFHGRTMGSLALTGSRSGQQKGFFPVMPGVHHVPYADCYRCAYGKTPDTCAVECIQAIEDPLFRTVLPHEEVAAIVVEPVQGEGGYIVPPRKFFDELRRLADKHGILLIFDEVQCGMGRTGRMFASEHFGAVPDIVTLAKGIASGMPLSATIARADLMQWPPGSHASTFGGNPVSVAASLATIEVLEQELVANAAAVGAHMKERLSGFPERFPMVGDVRGLGLMIGIELVRDQATKERAPDLRDRVVQMCFERGLLVLGAGPNTIRLSPPLVITRDQADFAIDTIAACLGAL